MQRRGGIHRRRDGFVRGAVDIDELRDSWFSRESVGVNDGEYAHRLLRRTLPIRITQGRATRVHLAYLAPTKPCYSRCQLIPQMPAEEPARDGIANYVAARADLPAWRLATNLLMSKITGERIRQVEGGGAPLSVADVRTTGDEAPTVSL